MIDTLITDSIIIGSFIIGAAILAVVACWAMDRHHDRTPLFLDGYGRPAPREAVPDLAPSPADPEPGPVAAPAAVTRPSYVTDEIGDRDADAWVESAWDRIQVRALNEKLREDAT